MKTQVVGLPLYLKMKSENDFSSVLSSAITNHNVDPSEAETLLDAFLQWFSLIPLVQPNQMYLMMKCNVDDIFHAFVMDNYKQYEEFCHQNIGYVMGHHPVELDVIDSSILEKGVKNTISLLQEHFSDNLHPYLKKWFTDFNLGIWHISCGKNCPKSEDAHRFQELQNGALVIH